MIQDNRIDLEKLPPAHSVPIAIGMNSAERFFEELRADLSNQVFEDIEAVENFLCNLLRKYFENPEAVSQLTLCSLFTTRIIE